MGGANSLAGFSAKSLLFAAGYPAGDCPMQLCNAIKSKNLRVGQARKELKIDAARSIEQSIETRNT